MEEKLQEIVVLLARIEADLRHHIKRTELLEEEVRGWKGVLLKLQAHVALVQSISKFTLGLAALAGTIAAFITIK